jgi:UDP-glucose:(heptosyl)LPS alpha-1,3-glucosyltransferase
MKERRKRIGVVIPKYGTVGGAEGFVAELTERLALSPDWEIHVFANRWVRRSDRVTFHRVSVIPFPRFFVTPSFALYAAKEMESLGIDLIHSHERIFAADLFTMHGTPHRYWVHTVRGKPAMSLFDRTTAWVERRLVTGGRCSRYFAVSELTRKLYLEEYGLDPGIVEVHHPGVDMEMYDGLDREACRREVRQHLQIGLREPVILFVSMNFEVKGLDRILAGLGEIKLRRPTEPFRLLVVGRGNEKKYRGIAQKLGVDDRVLFTGPIPREELAKVYLASDVYAMLSTFDTFGMVVLEAMAAGLPVAVSGTVGARDVVVPGENGFVIEEPQRPAEVAAILSILLNARERERMGEAARRTAREHSWEKAAGRVEEHYRRLLFPREG